MATSLTRKILIAILISPLFIVSSCVGGFIVGTKVAIDNEMSDGGGRLIKDAEDIPSHFYVLVRDVTTGVVTARQLSDTKKNELNKTVAIDPNTSFLLPAKTGVFGTGKFHEISGFFQAESINETRQRIILDWTENDDVGGVLTYIAENNSVTPLKYGTVGPGVMFIGGSLGLGLLFSFIIIGGHVQYIVTEKRTRPFFHYMQLGLFALPGIFFLYMAIKQLI